MTAGRCSPSRCTPSSRRTNVLLVGSVLDNSRRCQGKCSSRTSRIRRALLTGRLPILLRPTLERTAMLAVDLFLVHHTLWCYSARGIEIGRHSLGATRLNVPCWMHAARQEANHPLTEALPAHVCQPLPGMPSMRPGHLLCTHCAAPWPSSNSCLAPLLDWE